jgi:hypothetical protein
MDKTTQYRQLQPEDRMTMASMKQQGSSARAMARALGGAQALRCTAALVTPDRVIAVDPQVDDVDGFGWAHAGTAVTAVLATAGT